MTFILLSSPLLHTLQRLMNNRKRVMTKFIEQRHKFAAEQIAGAEFVTGLAELCHLLLFFDRQFLR